MSITTGTQEEIVESLNGWEELAIQQTFGTTVAAFAMEGPKQDAIMLARALAAVMLARRGAPEHSGPVPPMEFKKHHLAVMAMPQSQVQAMFESEGETEEPGKGEPQHDPLPTILQPSPSSLESAPANTPI